MAYLGRRGALAPLTSADIPVGIVEGTDIAFLENASGTQNLTGTYSTERMYLNDSYTLTGDVTVTGHLALGSIADEDIIITNDGTERTITTDASGGTLEAGNVLQDTHRTSLTDMTGVLGSAVTGSPALNLGNATGTLGSGVVFPTNHVIQTKIVRYNIGSTWTSSTAWGEVNTNLRITHAMSNSSNELIFIWHAVDGYVQSGGKGYVGIGKSTDVTTNILDHNLAYFKGTQNQEISSMTGVSSYSPGVTTEFTYTVLFKKETHNFYVGNLASISENRLILMEIAS